MARILSLLLLLFPVAVFANDLSVGYISRLPEMEYVWGSTNPTREGWPAVGQQVTWRAHVRNVSPTPADIRYEWRIDGAVVQSGTMHIDANTNATADLQDTWSFDRHHITFVADGQQLEVFSDALAVGFWVEQSFYDFFNRYQRDLGTGSLTFEDWAQRIIRLYNDEAALAIYPETPAGVYDRWRLQKVVVVPDGALPLTPIPNEGMMDGEPTATQMPDRSDRTVDLQWGFRTSMLYAYQDHRTISPDNPFYLEASVVHELGHARYLTDAYAWNVPVAGTDHTIDIMENGARVVGSPFMPFDGVYVHFSADQGLMNHQFTFIDRYSAAALNRIAGARATRGNYNDPENIGSFLNDLPAENRLTIRDRSGQLLRNAEIRIYQSAGDSDAWYATHYDNTPDVILQTDENGQVRVGRNPFATDGPVKNYWRSSNVVAIVRVATATQVLYGFLESREFNLAYWRGEMQFADHDLSVGAPFCREFDVPTLAAPAYDAQAGSPLVTLSWNPVAGGTKYTVWASSNGGRPQAIESTTSTTASAYLPGVVYWWVEAEVPGCPSRRSDASRFSGPAPVRRRAVHSQ
jgi:hypothetical protein